MNPTPCRFRIVLRGLQRALLGTAIVAATAQPGHAQNGIVAYDYLDFTSGQPVAQLAVIKTDGSGDQLLPVNLPEPGFPAWSKNGQALALTSIDPARPNKISRDVFVFRPGTGQLTKLTSNEDVANANGFITTYPWYKAFSGDGTKLAVAGYYLTGARAIQIYTNQNGDQVGPYDPLSKVSKVPAMGILDLNTGAAISVSLGPLGDDLSHPGDGVDWSPTQNVIAYPINTPTLFENATAPIPITTIHLVQPETDAVDHGKHQQITFPTGRYPLPFEPSVVSWADDFQPAFSPDGKRLAYIRAYSYFDQLKEPSLPSLRIGNLDGSGDGEVIHFRWGDYISHVTWSSDGTKLIFDLGAQIVYQGVSYPLILPQTAGLYSVGVNGTGFAPLRGVPATWPAGNPVGGIAPPPAPQIATLSPTEAMAGGAAFDLKVTGANFVNGAEVRWNGAALPTAFSSATELHATVSAARIAAKGTANVVVVTPGANGQTSNQVLFTIKDPAVVTPPKMTFKFNGGAPANLVVSWPTAAGSFTLETSAKLGPQASWTKSGGSVVSAAGVNSVTLSFGGSSAFFRLHQTP